MKRYSQDLLKDTFKPHNARTCFGFFHYFFDVVNVHLKHQRKGAPGGSVDEASDS